MDSYGGRITACYQENKDPVGSYNTGFAASHGEIICILDSDENISPAKYPGLWKCSVPIRILAGFFDEQPQGALRVHGRNMVSGVEGTQKISSIIRTTINNAYRLQNKAVFTQVFEQDIYAQGRSLVHKFNDIDQYHKNLMQAYISNVTFEDRLEILLFELYYRYIWTPR